MNLGALAWAIVLGAAINQIDARTGRHKRQSSGVCKPLAAPTDGQINCGDSIIFYRCTAQCNSGYEFDNGDSTIQKDCDPMTGQFFSGPAFPKCIPTCSLACQNGGTCVQPNVCSCAPGWNGTFCESLDGGGPGSNAFGFGTSDVCKPLAAPTDGQINCGDSTTFYRCTAQCNSGYEFDNGDSTIQKDCDPMTGQFFSGPAFPKCIPTCSPVCQNGGTCVQPNVCSCAPGWNGPFCESLDGGGPGSNLFGFGTSDVCKPLAAPTDGQINCGDSTIFYRCTAQCNSGYEFDNGDSTIQKDCDPMTGQFFDGPAFPNCIPTCSPVCQNGGTCVQPNVCSCAPGWNGTFCESLDGGGPGSNAFGFGTLSACKPLAAPTNGQINCGDTTIFYQCTAQCNSGYEFDNGDTAIQKDCDPMTGQFFDGPAFPKCIPTCNNPEVMYVTCSPACQNGKTCVQPNVCS